MCNCNKNNLSGLGAINSLCVKYPEMCANAGKTAQVNPQIAQRQKELAIVNTGRFKNANAMMEEKSEIPKWVAPTVGIGIGAIILYMIL